MALQTRLNSANILDHGIVLLKKRVMASIYELAASTFIDTLYARLFLCLSSSHLAASFSLRLSNAYAVRGHVADK